MVREHVSGGAYITARAIFDSELWLHPAQHRIFEFIRGRAVFAKEGCMVAGIHVPRGSFLCSYRKLAEGTAWLEKNNCLKQYSISTVKRVTDELIRRGCLKKSESATCTIWTVCNYEKYQDWRTYANGTVEQGCGIPLVSNAANDIKEDGGLGHRLRNGTAERLRNKNINVNECSLLFQKAERFLSEQGIQFSHYVLAKKMEKWTAEYEEDALSAAFKRGADAWCSQSKSGDFLRYLGAVLKNDFPKRVEAMEIKETAAA